jgi:hypothetical protein
MKEKRQDKRLKEVIEITTTVLSGEENLPKEEIFHSYIKDISKSGARIRSTIIWAVDNILKIDFTLKNLRQKITALGKVKWTKNFIDDRYYEAGVEFVNTPSEVIKKVDDHIFWKEECTSLNPFGLKSYEN